MALGGTDAEVVTDAVSRLGDIASGMSGNRANVLNNVVADLKGLLSNSPPEGQAAPEGATPATIVSADDIPDQPVG